MIDPSAVPDIHGLSADSLRGSEALIRVDLVGAVNVTNPNDASKNFSRDPLSFHEARTLLLQGQDVPPDSMHPDVQLHIESEAERLPTPAPNDVQMQALPGSQDPEFLAWKAEKTKQAQAELAQYNAWKASQSTGTAPPIAAVQTATTSTQPAYAPSVTEATPPGYAPAVVPPSGM